jgi:hypothetical protein
MKSTPFVKNLINLCQIDGKPSEAGLAISEEGIIFTVGDQRRQWDLGNILQAFRLAFLADADGICRIVRHFTPLVSGQSYPSAFNPELVSSPRFWNIIMDDMDVAFLAAASVDHISLRDEGNFEIAFSSDLLNLEPLAK